jgi:two-component system, OmpR family, osmolarity sensor histidine kinase EnvZ
VTLPRRKLWRFFFWIAFAAILLEVLGLTNTFLELQRRNRGNTAGLAPDQIAAVVHLWPSLNETQRRDLLSAVSGSGISFRVTSQPPIASSEDVRAREVEDAVRKRLNGSEANSVVALIRSSPGSPSEHRTVIWPLATEPMRVYVRLTTGDWLDAEVQGDLLPRFFGLPTGFWVGIVGLLLAGGVLLVILREGRAIERIARSVEAFASTGVPQVFEVGGSPEIAGLARRTLRMQQQVAMLFMERNAMLGGIAHDMKTFIQRLKLRLEVLDDPAQVEKAKRDLDAMNKLVEDALLVAVHSNPLQGKQTVDLWPIVAEEVEIARMAGGHVSLKGDGAGSFFVNGDRPALSRAMSNIIGNALRYGSVAHVSVHGARETIEVIVEDCGPGIPVSERHAVFTAFHRGESSRNRSSGGTGLGLAIALGIIESQQGGSIEIGDAPGAGARITIGLPRARIR